MSGTTVLEEKKVRLEKVKAIICSTACSQRGVEPNGNLSQPDSSIRALPQDATMLQSLKGQKHSIATLQD